MGGIESKNVAFEAVVCLFSNAEHEMIAKIYANLCKGHLQKGFQSQDLKVCSICFVYSKNFTNIERMKMHFDFVQIA